MALVFVVSCASRGATSSKGELTVNVVATSFIGHIDFHTRDGSDAVQVAAIPAGLTDHTLRVKPGDWCLHQIGLGAGSIGVTIVPREQRCVQVGAGQTIAFGYVAVDGQNIKVSSQRPAPRDW